MSPQNGFAIFALKHVLKYLFVLCFEHQPKFAQNWALKNDNFSHFKNTGH